MKTLSEHCEQKERSKVIAKKMTCEYVKGPKYMSSTRQSLITTEEKQAYSQLAATYRECESVQVAAIKMSVGDHVLFYKRTNVACDCFKVGEIRVVLHKRTNDRSECMFVVREKYYEVNETFQCVVIEGTGNEEVVETSQLAGHLPLQVVEMPTDPKSVIALPSEPTLCYQ